MKRILAYALPFVLLAGLAWADDIGAVVTLTTHAAGTVTSVDQANSRVNAKTLSCVFNQSAHTGSPSTTFKIQGKDAATGQYYDMIVSSAVTDDATPTVIAAGAGLDTVSHQSASLPIPATWRVSTTVGGTSTPTITAKIGCNRGF